MSHRRAAACLTAVAIAGASALTVTPAANAQNGENYVALGDSYASGVGAGQYDGICLRSPLGYPQLWADSHNVANFENVTCGGAVTDDVNSEQIPSLSNDTTLATLQIGGNDVGFARTVLTCQLGTDADCDAAVSEGERVASEELPAKLDQTYSNVSKAAPNARVIVLGYPRLTEPGQCDVEGFSEAKRKRLNEGADHLAGVIQQRATAAGFEYVDPRPIFDGHGICGDPQWIHGPDAPLVEGFHPNVDGYAKGYLPALNAVTDK